MIFISRLEMLKTILKELKLRYALVKSEYSKIYPQLITSFKQFKACSRAQMIKSDLPLLLLLVEFQLVTPLSSWTKCSL